MTRTQSRARERRSTRNTKLLAKSAAASKEIFPPLTTSLETFVKDGSDRALRRLIYNLTRLFNQMLRMRKHFAAYVGLTEAQLLMITFIAEMQCSTVGQIAEALNVSSQFVTAEIGDLVEKHIVEKRPNEADGRSMLLDLTAKGRNLLRDVAPLRRKANDTHWRSLTEDRARLLEEIVNTLISDGNISLHELESPVLQGRKAPSA